MAIYNGFPATYQPVYYPQYQPVQQAAPQQTQQAQQASGGIIWVQGEAGAKSYLVAPNTTVQLWDSEKQTIYLKSADASGMPSMKTLDYTIREMPQAQAPTEPQNAPAYATKEELAALGDRISALKKEIDDANAKRRARRLTEDE